jgi:hypothetical protein
MKRRTDVLIAIRVCLFLLGPAAFDRAFEVYHAPPLVAECHKKPDAAALSFDDGEQPVVNLTVPQLHFMPRHFTAGPGQYAEQPESFVRGPTTLNRYGTVWLPSPAAPRLAV